MAAAGRRLLFGSIFLTTLFLSGATAETPAGEKQRGVSWVAAPRVISAAEFQPLVDHHVTWIVQTPFGWQRSYDSPEVALVTGGRIFWGERDEGLEVTTRLARQRGIKTLLKPHLWLRHKDGKWRSDIAMRSDAEWDAWFADYRTFILHYARLAERLGIEALSVGTELRSTVLHDADAWRRLIAEVRQVYRGELTYAANWWKEFEEVPFWDDLDYIGIQAYFPLGDEADPSLEDLKRGWLPHVEAIERIHRRFDKPVLFTEIGYKNAPGATREPWVWPTNEQMRSGKTDDRLQADAYRAFFEVVWPRPWLAGAYIWKWIPAAGEVRFEGVGFTPQGRPALAVMAEAYRSDGAPEPTRTSVD